MAQVFEVGDVVVKYRAYSATTYCAHGGLASEVPLGSVGKVVSILNLPGEGSRVSINVKFDNGFSWQVSPEELKLKESKMFKSLGNDLQVWFKNNQELIFGLGFVLLLDYFLFNGAFRQRITDIVHKTLGNIESKLAVKTEAPTA